MEYSSHIFYFLSRVKIDKLENSIKTYAKKGKDGFVEAFDFHKPLPEHNKHILHLHFILNLNRAEIHSAVKHNFDIPYRTIYFGILPVGDKHYLLSGSYRILDLQE
jgi:hypothetical protein